jgi:DNA polymerase elongation subunit (family B)/DNA replicative helicase MCM subunit Mcm2 (Cdc46/Mcm family)
MSDEDNNNNQEAENEFDLIWRNSKLEKKITSEGDTIAFNPENKWTYFQIKPERQKLMHIAYGKFHPSGSSGQIWFDDGTFTILLVNPKPHVFTGDYHNAVKAKIELLERQLAEKEGRRYENMSPDEKRQFKLDFEIKISNGASFLVRYVPPIIKWLESGGKKKGVGSGGGDGGDDPNNVSTRLFGANPPNPFRGHPNVLWINGKPSVIIHADRIGSSSIVSSDINVSSSSSSSFSNGKTVNYKTPSEIHAITQEGTPVRVEGVIATVEAPKKKRLKVCWKCRSCEYEFPLHTFTKITEVLQKPKECPSCEQKHPNLFEERHTLVYTRVVDLRDIKDSKDSDITTTQVLLIDYPEMAMPPTSMNQLPVIHPAGRQTNSISIGGKVKVAGHIEHYSVENNRQGISSEIKSVVVSHHAEIENRRTLTLTEQDIIAIKRFAGKLPLSYTPSFVDREVDEKTGQVTYRKLHVLNMQDTVYERLRMLSVPHLVVDWTKKDACLLIATGAPESRKVRGRISCISLGPPATGKTELMYGCMDMRPDSKMVSGAGHATGNTATAVVLQEPDGTRKLHLGNIPRASGSVCGVNEIDKFSVPEQNRIMLEVVDKGRIPLEKFGEIRDIPAQTSIFATANPKDDQWKQKDKIHLHEIPLEPTKLSRFDIFLTHRDDDEEHKNFIYSIEKRRKEKRLETIRGQYEPVFLQRIIEYARRFNPQVTESVDHTLSGYYAMLTKKSKGLFDKRHQGAIFRIAKAYARLQLSEVVDDKIAHITQQFMNATLGELIRNLVVLQSPSQIIYDQAIKYLQELHAKDPEQWTDLSVLLENYIRRESSNGNYRVKEWFIHGRDGKAKPLTVKANWRFRQLHDEIAHDERIELHPESAETRVRWRKTDGYDGYDGQSSSNGEENLMGDVQKRPPPSKNLEKNEGSSMLLEQEPETIKGNKAVESCLTTENFQNFDRGGDFGTSPVGFSSPIEILHGSCASVDLEWDRKRDDMITQFSFKDHTKRSWVIHIKDPEFEGDEVELIKKGIATMRKYRMILGYYTQGKNSDWAVLDKRCNALGLDSPINVWEPQADPDELLGEKDDDDDDDDDADVNDDEEGGEETENSNDNNNKQRIFYNLSLRNYEDDKSYIQDIDICLLHQKQIVRNFFAQSDIVYNSTELDAVSKARLNRGKFKGVSGANVQKQTVEVAKAYGQDDAELTYDLAVADNNVLFTVLNEIAEIVRLPFERVCKSGPTKWWTNYYREVMHIEPDENRVIPKKKKKHDQETYKGGKVFISKKLTSYENVTVFDFRQLYPNTAILQNLAPDVICCECCRDDPSARIVTNSRNINEKNYWTCRKRKGSYPQAMEILTALRSRYEEQAKIASNDKEHDELKAKEYNLRAAAAKLFSNSGYGVYGSAYFEYGDVRTAELITACGRTKLDQLRKIGKEQFGFDVVYGDTDSIFALSVPAERRKEFEDFCEKKLGIPARFEKHFFRMLLLRPKNYMGDYVDKKGKRGFLVKGLVGKKSDTAPWARKIFEQVRDHWKDNDLDLMIPAVRQGVEDLQYGKVEKEDLLITKKLGQDPHTGYRKSPGRDKLAQVVYGVADDKHKDDSIQHYLSDETRNDKGHTHTRKFEEISIDAYKKRLETAVLKILFATGFEIADIYRALELKVPTDKELNRKLYGDKKKEKKEKKEKKRKKDNENSSRVGVGDNNNDGGDEVEVSV